MGWEKPLEEGMAIHSRILAWRIPWTEEPGRPQSTGSQSDVTEATKYTHIKQITNENLLYSIANSPQTSLWAPWGPKSEGNSKKRRYLYMYS